MKVVLTGASGFLGSRVLGRLRAKGHTVYSLVRGFSGAENEIIWDFASELPQNLPECEAVIHLAASVDFSEALDLGLFEANTVATLRLALFCRKMGSHLIYASTTGVHGYGAQVIHAGVPLNPDTPYAMSKLLGEKSVTSVLKAHTIFRICGIYGYKGPLHLGLNRAISNAVEKKMPPLLIGPGQGQRNYICVDDAARWIVVRVETLTVPTAGAGEVVYMCGHEILSIREQLLCIAEELLSGSSLVEQPGKDTQNMVVVRDSFPIEMTSFRQYLKDLLHLFERS